MSEVLVGAGAGLSGVLLGIVSTFLMESRWDHRMQERDKRRALRAAVQEVVVWSRRFQLQVALRQPLEREGAAENDVTMDILISRLTEDHPKVRTALVGLLNANQDGVLLDKEGDLGKIRTWTATQKEQATLLFEAADREMGW